MRLPQINQSDISSLSPKLGQLLSTLSPALSLLSQSGLSEKNRPIRLSLNADQAAVDHALLVKHLTIDWAINDGLKADVVCLSTHSALPLKELVGQPIRIDQVTDEGALFGVCGLVTQASAGQSDGSLTVYRLEIEDSLALLKRRRQSRVFLDQSIVDITQVLFDEWCSLSPLFNSTIGLDRSKLQADYPKISFTQQQSYS